MTSQTRSTQTVDEDDGKEDQTRSTQIVDVEPWEIGGALLDILSRGLYSDARDAIREYVQNGVDAEATTIYVTVSGPNVTVRDDGAGMSRDELRKARRFGVSDKSPMRHVGYRGIGIYSAFGMCETLSILTRPLGSDDQFRLEFRFGEMRRLLERDRMAEERQQIGLAGLLRDFTSFTDESYEGPSDEHFTLVTLQGLSQEYRAQLHDDGAFYNYLLTSLPVTFPSRSYGPRVNGWLRRHARLNPVRLILRVGTEDERGVHPQIVSNVHPPQRLWINEPNNGRAAFMWYALTKRGQRIPSHDDSSGFLLKIKGFTLGDRLLLKALWPATGGKTLYHHFTGEVHALDAAGVYPNAARNGLEPSPSKQTLEGSLRDVFRELNEYADNSRNIVRAERKIQAGEGTLGSLREKVRGGDENPFDLYRRAKDLEDELKKSRDDLSRVLSRRQSLLLTGQREMAESLRISARALLKSTAQVVRSAGRRAEDDREAEEEYRDEDDPVKPRPRRTRGTPQLPPPQSAVLVKIAADLRASFEGSTDPRLIHALEEIDVAKAMNSVRRAVEVLDELKSVSGDLPEDVELARMEMRESLGLTAAFPVSLMEALAEEGFIVESNREDILIFSVDSGLLDILGGRGEDYDGALAAIVNRLDDYIPPPPRVG